MNNLLLSLTDLCVSVLFILSLRGLAFPQSAYRSNIIGIIGMIIAITASTLTNPNLLLIFLAIVIGALIGWRIAYYIKMTALPQTIAAFNGLGGLAAFLVAVCATLNQNSGLDIAGSAVIGIFTFSGSFIAFAKLQGLIKQQPDTHLLNMLLSIALLTAIIVYYHNASLLNFGILTTIACALGIFITFRIGGADMPIVISLLNAGSGLASAAVGFMMNSSLLIITGALIGAGGSILSYVMSKAMNRNLRHILFGKQKHSESIADQEQRLVKTGSPLEAAYLMENASKVIIVPGYGMAVSQAQHTLKQMSSLLKQKYNVDVRFAIHPVAGRMPGHMNVLLAEADVPYENIFGFDEINNEFATADVAYIIGANDIVNPLAKNDSSSPIYGMPIFDAALAKTVFVIKRSMASGYSGLDNPLFYADNTIMLFGDAQKVTAEIVKILEH